MAALAADVNCSTVGHVITAPFSNNVADIYYRGSIVYIDTAGGAQVVPAAGDMAIGISPKKQDVAAGAIVDVLIFGLVWLPLGSNIAAADEGDIAMLDISAIQSDNPADLVAQGDITLAANDVSVGRIMRCTSTQMLIFIGPNTGAISIGAISTTGWSS
jgi:hypothetical protein